MKIKFELDLEDLLTEDFDYFEETNTLRLKDESELKETINYKIIESVVNCIKNSFKNPFNYEIQLTIRNLINENKQTIIDNVVKEVSKKIINNKQIKDFKKTLD